MFFKIDKMDESELRKTIFPSDEGTYTQRATDSITSEHTDMLSLAVKIDRKSEKKLKVTFVVDSISVC